MDSIALIFAAVGAFTALSGAWRLLTARRFESRASRACAKVTDVREEWVPGRRGQRRVRVPVVRFTAADGRSVEAQTTAYSGFGGPQPGDSLEVLYDPEDPGDVRRPGGAGALLSAGAGVAFGVVFALIGLSLLR